MLESLRVRPAICTRIRSGPLGAWIEPFIVTLAERGYASSVQRRYLRAAAMFGVWMTRHRIAAAMVDEAVVGRFPGAHPRCVSPSRPPWFG